MTFRCEDHPKEYVPNRTCSFFARTEKAVRLCTTTNSPCVAVGIIPIKSELFRQLRYEMNLSHTFIEGAQVREERQPGTRKRGDSASSMFPNMRREHVHFFAPACRKNSCWLQCSPRAARVWVRDADALLLCIVVRLIVLFTINCNC